MNRRAILLLLVVCLAGTVHGQAGQAGENEPWTYWKGVPEGQSPYVFGMHDPGAEDIMEKEGTPGWVVHAIEIGHDPNNNNGFDFSRFANRGFGIICRLQHGWGSGGSVPKRKHHDDFAKRVANFVKNSRGCHIWLIGNETNLDREWPSYEGGPEQVTPEDFAECFVKCYKAIKALPNGKNEIVVTQSISPWAIIAGIGSEDYYKRMMAAVGNNVDGISIHAYSHGPDPNGVFSEHRGHAGWMWDFRTYRDIIKWTPVNLLRRKVPFFITESGTCDPMKWHDESVGWIPNAFSEIAAWNFDPRNPKIRALCLYRWQPYDQHNISTRPKIVSDFKKALHDLKTRKGITWTMKPPEKNPPPKPPEPPPAPVAADAGPKEPPKPKGPLPPEGDPRVDWQQLHWVRGNTKDSMTCSFDEVKTKRLRVRITKASSAEGADCARLGEVLFFGSAGIAIPVSVKAGSTQDGFSLGALYDGDPTYQEEGKQKGWASWKADSKVQHWIVFEFNKKVGINQVQITTARDAAKMVKDLIVEIPRK